MIPQKRARGYIAANGLPILEVRFAHGETDAFLARPHDLPPHVTLR